MKAWVLLAVLAAPLDAQEWRLSDALGSDRGPAPSSAEWLLRVEPRTGGEERTLFHNGKEDHVRLVDWDAAGRVTKWRDLRDGKPVWEVSLDPITGLPARETTFDQGNPSETATLRFEGRTLTGRMVRDGAGEWLYTDKLYHWPDGSLRRLERDGPDGPLADAAWSYGAGRRLTRAWLADPELKSKGQHRTWNYETGRTEEVLSQEAAAVTTRVTEALEAGSRETFTQGTEKRVTKLDARGRKVEEIVTVKDAVTQTKRWVYDDQGRLTHSLSESVGPREEWSYEYHDGLVDTVLTRDGILVRRETSRDSEKLEVRFYDRGELFLVETWNEGRRVKESYYDHGSVIRERTF